MIKIINYSEIFVMTICLCFASASFADSDDRALIASKLFNIPLESIDDNTVGANYNYNTWGDDPNTTGACDGYRGGHSGLDIQTKSVAGAATADENFYAVSNGEVITAGGDGYNTIAIYDERRNITVLYLHAREVGAEVGDTINVGDLLGVQGSTGAGTAEHVHLEARNLRRTGPACGVTTTIDPETNILPYLHTINLQPIISLLLQDESSVLIVDSGYLSDIEYQNIFDEMLEKDYFPSIVEGKIIGDKQKYRGFFEPYPIGDFEFESRHGVSQSYFDQRNNDLLNNGFLKLWQQTFSNNLDQLTFQASWVLGNNRVTDCINKGKHWYQLSCHDKPFDDGLRWPIACTPGNDCLGLGLPDIDNDGKAYDCEAPGYTGHQGTDISAEYGTTVYAAEAGEVLWVFDGKDDNCPSSSADCQAPPNGWGEPGESNGFRVCTELGPYCGTGHGECFWCFDGGNVVVVRHLLNDRIFATRYDHFKKGSILVNQGDNVLKGQKIGEVGSSGHSSGPHLHFEVWGSGFYQLAEPWAGSCGPNYSDSLWEHGSNTPWN